MNRTGWLVVSVATAIAAGLLTAPSTGTAAINKLEVKGVELGCRIGSQALKARLTLGSREAVEYTTDNPQDVERLLQMVQVFGSSRARMFAEVEGHQVRAIQVAVE